MVGDDDDEWSDMQPLLSKELHQVQSDGEGTCSVTSAAASGDILSLGQDALMITGITQAKSPPHLLLVESPNLLNDCAGCYTTGKRACKRSTLLETHKTRLRS